MQFPVYTQQRRLSCGPSCIKILMEFFDIKNDITEDQIAHTCFTTHYTGTIAKWLLRWLKKHLPNHKHTFITHADKDTLIEYLKSWNPAILLYMVDRIQSPHVDDPKWNYYGLHYTVAYKIEGNHVWLSNPFWFIEKITIEDLRDRMSLDNKYLGRKEKVLVKLWIVKKHTIIFTTS